MNCPALMLLTVLFWPVRMYSQPVSGQPANLNEGRQSKVDLVHFGDLIDVDVVGSFEFDWRGRLSPEGFLDGFDRIERQIYGLCKSEEQIADAITKEYSAVLRDPKVVVKILDRTNRAVAFLDGAVRFPQRFQIRRPVFLNELLIVSGGLTDNASGDIRIFRPVNMNCGNRAGEANVEGTASVQDSAFQISIVRIADLLSGAKEANPQISSGDIVTVVEAARIYVIGGVEFPKQIALRSEITLSRAIAMAGGLSKDAVETRISIFRRDGKERRVIQANLKQIAANEAKDPLLLAFDIIDVGRKGNSERKLPPPVEAVTDRDSLAKLPLRIID